MVFVLLRVARSRRSRRSAHRDHRSHLVKSMMTVVEPREGERGKAYGPHASVALFEGDVLSGEGFGQEQAAIAPRDGAVGGHATDLQMPGVVQRRQPWGQGARRIVESLSLPLSLREHQLLRHDVPGSGTAYAQYLRANRLSADTSTWDAARDLYLESIRADPHYAPAW